MLCRLNCLLDRFAFAVSRWCFHGPKPERGVLAWWCRTVYLRIMFRYLR